MCKSVVCTVEISVVARFVLADEKTAAAEPSVLIVSTHSVWPNPEAATFTSPWITVLSTHITPPGAKDLGFLARTALADITARGGSLTGASRTSAMEGNVVRATMGGRGSPVVSLISWLQVEIKHRRFTPGR